MAKSFAPADLSSTTIPNVKKDFSKASDQPASNTSPGRGQAGAPPSAPTKVVSPQQLQDQLRARGQARRAEIIQNMNAKRPAPKQENVLTMKGVEGRTAYANASAEKNQKLDEQVQTYNHGVKQTKGVAKEAFKLGQTKGKAKDAFDRNR